MCHGRREWRNIQEVVRAAFKVLFDVVATQDERIGRLEAELQRRPTHDELETRISRTDCLQRLEAKTNESDFRRAMAEVTAKVDAHGNGMRALGEDVVAVNTLLRQKANASDVAAALNAKADAHEMAEALSGKATLALLQDQLALKANIADVNEALAQKANKASVASALQQKASRADLESVQGQLLERPVRVEAAEMIDSRLSEVSAELRKEILARPSHSELERKANASEVHAALSAKVDRKDFQDTLHSVTSRMSIDIKSAIVDLSQQTEKQQRIVDELIEHTRRTTQNLGAEVDTKADRRETDRALASKANNDEFMRLKAICEDMQRELADKADANMTSVALRDKADAKKVDRALELKAGVDDVACRATIASVEELAREVALRASIKDVCTLLDSKASIEDINRALGELTKEVDHMTRIEDFNRAMKEQALINASLVSEQCVARWIWKTGKTKANQMVPWNIQSVNSNPDNFMWEKDRTFVVAVTPGLYELTFGFFCKKKPSVQLMINGEAVMSAVNTASYVVHHSSGRVASVGQHSAGSVTGLTLIDFLALPAKSRIAIAYNGEEGAEGFLGLRKL